LARHRRTTRSSDSGASGWGRRERCRLAFQDGGDEAGGAAAFERPPARHHLVEDRAQGPDVGAGIDGPAFELLGRHVGHRAEDRSLRGEQDRIGLRRRQLVGGALLAVGPEPGQTEVQELRSRGRRHHVAGLEVAVDDTVLVGGRKGVGDLRSDLERLGQGERPLLQRLGERLAAQVLHHEERLALLLPDVVQRADGGVLEGGDGARLPLEAGAQRGIESELRRQDLQRDRALEAGVAGPVDLAHAPGPDQVENLVRAEAHTRRQGHGCDLVG
jgi:hypothetical protein